MKTDKKQKEEINKLFKNSAELANQANNKAIKLYNVEQYGRRQNLEFTRVIEQNDGDTSKSIVQLAKLLNVEIKESDISTSYRLHVPLTPKRDLTKLSEPPAITARSLHQHGCLK